MRRTIFCLALAVLLVGVNCSPSWSQVSAVKPAQMEVTSTAFTEGGMIPSKYTCDGKDLSPPLALSGTPKETKSIVLICDDPDAPVGAWVHWVLYNLPPDTKALPEDIGPRSKLDSGAIHGKNSRPKLGYGGPCPPSGTHRYYFKIYALDTMLSLKPGATKAQVLKAMKGHVVGEGKLMGKYKRQR